jgi:hypothetical protein
MPRRVDKTHHPEKLALATAVVALWLSAVADGRRAFGTFVKRRVGVANFYRDAPPQLFAVGAGPDAGDGLYKCGLAVVDMARGADVDAGLVAVFLDVPFRQGLFPVQSLLP